MSRLLAEIYYPETKETSYGRCPDCGHHLDGWNQNDCIMCGWRAVS